MFVFILTLNMLHSIILLRPVRHWTIGIQSNEVLGVSREKYKRLLELYMTLNVNHRNDDKIRYLKEKIRTSRC